MDEIRKLILAAIYHVWVHENSAHTGTSGRNGYRALTVSLSLPSVCVTMGVCVDTFLTWLANLRV